MESKEINLHAIHYATGEPVSICLEQGMIRSIEPITLETRGTSELAIVAPGLVDLQINGYAGHDFNHMPYADKLVGEVIRKLWQEGVTSCFPTVITNSDQAIQEALESIAFACREDAAADQGIAGIHLEGPFISAHDGARGAHALKYVKPPDWELFTRWQEASGGRIRIVTLSPEWPDSAKFIAKCTESGVTVSIGHTSATPEQICEAVEAGARMSTHLGNGAHLMMPRHPNYIWEQLAQDRLWSSVIADGFHLPDQVLKVVFKVKGAQAMLVSDAVSLSGLPAGAYTTHIGGSVVLTPEGKLHLAEDDNLLAGSAQMLLRGIEHVTNRALADLAEAWDMASVRPSSCMKLPSSSGLAPGAPADLVLFRRAGNQIRLERTFKSGKEVFVRKDLLSNFSS
ncbi:N-acetylglucosamine-6-phosphate deacetylase [Paenibacillus ferrarius]|uniref:N-acetylglucosamine-6-phosphate deacetylase n=1 Tax=Paenibacillus ferrarius TaxID=1469647 RepID=A0A1V4HCT5_9BACL|nr:amidohydrolase family protein [Paenibacillus ferrarius]OPH49616.1 N-acetylglucosamine-6-phosphate deacetylase [Paenibacillus ferrarius]